MSCRDTFLKIDFILTIIYQLSNETKMNIYILCHYPPQNASPALFVSTIFDDSNGSTSKYTILSFVATIGLDFYVIIQTLSLLLLILLIFAISAPTSPMFVYSIPYYLANSSYSLRFPNI